ncbi:MAG: HAD family phosphatase [Eubacteriales bacterium]|nr:HAD family phosphatase [Eubacteriales bacterium]
MLEAVIFDMDGVIIDSEASFLRSKQQLLHELGVEVDVSYHYDFFGTTSVYTWTTLKKTFGLDPSVEQLIERANALREAVLREEGMKPIPGVLDLIRHLHDSGIRLAVASSSPMADILHTVSSFQVHDCFSTFASGGECQNGKPFPDVFLLAAERLGADPAACLVIEDSRNGLLAAKAAGMTCIAFANPDYVAQDLKEADRVVTDFASLTVADCRQLLV